MEISYNKKRARCRQCTEKNHRNTGSKRNNESQSEIEEQQKPTKIPKTVKEEIVEDPMEDMDLQGESKIQEQTGSLEPSTPGSSEQSIITTEIQKESTGSLEPSTSGSSEQSTKTQEKSRTKKVVFTNKCEKCNRTGKGFNTVSLIKNIRYWNHESQRIETQEMNICDKCFEKTEKEIYAQMDAYKEEYCNRCNTKGMRPEMQNRHEGFTTKYYCDLNCQYAQMIIYDVGSELENQDRIEILINKYTNSTRYAGSAYGSVSRSEILKKLYINKKEKEPMKYDEIENQLNRGEAVDEINIKLDEIIPNNDNQDQREKDLKDQKEQTERLQQELTALKEQFGKRIFELNNTIGQQNQQIEYLNDTITQKDQQIGYANEQLRLGGIQNTMMYEECVKKNQKNQQYQNKVKILGLMTEYFDKNIINKETELMELSEKYEDLFKEHDLVKQDLQEYEELAKQWEQQEINYRTTTQQIKRLKQELEDYKKEENQQIRKTEQELEEYKKFNLIIEQPIEVSPLTPGSQELFDSIMNDIDQTLNSFQQTSYTNNGNPLLL